MPLPTVEERKPGGGVASSAVRPLPEGADNVSDVERGLLPYLRQGRPAASSARWLSDQHRSAQHFKYPAGEVELEVAILRDVMEQLAFVLFEPTRLEDLVGAIVALFVIDAPPSLLPSERRSIDESYLYHMFTRTGERVEQAKSQRSIRARASPPVRVTFIELWRERSACTRSNPTRAFPGLPSKGKRVLLLGRNSI